MRFLKSIRKKQSIYWNFGCFSVGSPLQSLQADGAQDPYRIGCFKYSLHCRRPAVVRKDFCRFVKPGCIAGFTIFSTLKLAGEPTHIPN